MILTAALLSAAFAAPGIPAEDNSAYVAEMESWRKSQEADLLAPEGWLSVAGLYWLNKEDNPFKLNLADLNNAASLSFDGTNPTIQINPGFTGELNGKPFPSGSLKPEEDRVKIFSNQSPDKTITVMIIHRGNRTGVRVFNQKSEGRKKFNGMKWFPIQTTFRIKAKFTPYPTPNHLSITNVIGDTSMVDNPGYVTFSVAGKECRLEAESQGAGLFFNFRDKTSGKETYPAGRFLNTEAPENGTVTLDFNKAVNPPCAFTNFATCPLPPQANILSVKIPAGEKIHHPPA